MPTLYEALVSAKITTDHHESDLYFPVTLKSREILSKYPEHVANATTFRVMDGRNMMWYDVPFGYSPFWKK